MRGERLDPREEAILDGNKVGYFGSWTLNGSDELEEVACETGRWWNGDDLAEQPPATMGAAELDRRAAGY